MKKSQLKAAVKKHMDGAQRLLQPVPAEPGGWINTRSGKLQKDFMMERLRACRNDVDESPPPVPARIAQYRKFVDAYVEQQYKEQKRQRALLTKEYQQAVQGILLAWSVEEAAAAMQTFINNWSD